MLYTTYLAQLDKIPSDGIKILIMRYPPRDLNILKYNKIYIVSSLAPSKALIDEYNATTKSQSDWQNYKVKFVDEIMTRKDMKDAIAKVGRLLSSGLDVYLICYEKNYLHCHRTILARYIQKLFNVDYKEF